MSRMLVLLIASSFVLLAQGSIPKGARIFIEKMENDLDGYITAELLQKKVPLEVVAEPDLATYVMTGSGTAEQARKWHSGWLTAEQDRTTGNIRIFEKSTKKLVFAAEAGDRSLLFTTMRRGGARKVASRIADKLKKNLH
jgi:hypothetical protein